MVMVQANILETKNNLSDFLRMLERGEQDCIVIARAGKPFAKITLLEEREPATRIGAAEGMFEYDEAFDDPALNNEVARLFGVNG